MCPGAVVDHFHLIRCRIPLDMQRFGSLLDCEIGGSRLEIIIIRLPYHRRPARMAHPHQQTFTVLASGLEQTAVAVVVHPLCQFGKLFRTLRFAIPFRDDLVERGTALCPFACIVVHTPLVVLRPDSFRREGAEHAFVGHDVRHSSFTMELVIAGLQREILFCRKHTVRAVTAHHIVSRAGDIMDIRMVFLDDTA